MGQTINPRFRHAMGDATWRAASRVIRAKAIVPFQMMFWNGSNHSECLFGPVRTARRAAPVGRNRRKVRNGRIGHIFIRHAAALRHGMDGHATGRGEGDSRGLAIEGRKNHGALLDLSEKRSPRLGGNRDEEGSTLGITPTGKPSITLDDSVGNQVGIRGRSKLAR